MIEGVLLWLSMCYGATMSEPLVQVVKLSYSLWSSRRAPAGTSNIRRSFRKRHDRYACFH